MNSQKTPNTALTLSLFCLVFLAQSGLDIYLAAMPTMAHALKTSNTCLQLSLTAYLAMFGMGQIFLCPLSDIYGRKPILLLGFAFYFIGALLTGLSHSIVLLFCGRMLNGAGAAVFSGMSRAIACDSYQDKALASMFTMMSVAWALAPMLAPVMGSYIFYYFSWQAIFYALAWLSFMVMIFVYMMLPETNLAKEKYSIAFLYQVSISVLSTSTFLLNVLICLVLYSVFISINMVGPFLFQEQLHLTAIEYAWTTVLIGSGYLWGSIISRVLFRYFETRQIQMIGIVMAIVSILIAILFSYLYDLFFWFIVIPLTMTLFAIAFIYPGALAHAFKGFQNKLGLVSSIFGCLLYLGSMLMTLLVAYLPENNQNSMLGFILFQLLITWFMIILSRPKNMEAI